jgi:hypothetical protein
MSDSLYHGRRFRTLNILDEGVREALAIEIDTSLPAERVVRTVQQLAAWRGLPKAIRLDNGPELTAQRFTTWCAVMGIELRHIQPGKPIKTLSSNASIVPIGPKSLTAGCLGRSMKFAKSPIRGSSVTTRKALTMPWGTCPQRSTASACSQG